MGNKDYNEEHNKIHHEKDWNEIKANDTWEIFKMMSESVSGFETLAKIGPYVSIFSSASTTHENCKLKIGEKRTNQ